MARARASVEIAVPPPAVMAVLTDLEGYADFLVWVERVEVLRRERGADLQAWEARFDLVLIRPLSFVLRLERGGMARLSWTLVEGAALRVNAGAWTLVPVAGGQRTSLTFEVELRTAAYVPDVVLQSLRERELAMLLDRVAEESLARLPVAATDQPVGSR